MNNSSSRMDEERVSWYTQIGRLKRAYSSLTDADLNFEERSKGDLIASLTAKLGVSVADIRNVMIRPGRFS